MTGGSDKSVLSRIVNFFSKNSDEDALEKAIIEAREDGDLEQVEGSMLLSVLRLDELQVQDIMIPRTDMECMSAESSLNDVVSIIISSGHSRIPIYKEHRDNIVGIAYSKDILRSINDKDFTVTPITELMRVPYLIPETKKVKELLQEFKSRKNHMAVVIDEYGGTSGLVTIEDVIEVIVGDIEDEHDAPKEQEIKKLEDGVLLISGRTTLEELEDHGFKLETEDVETIGGYLCMLAGYVPRVGEVFEIEQHKFEIYEADAKQIKLIRVVPLNTVQIYEASSTD